MDRSGGLLRSVAGQGHAQRLTSANRPRPAPHRCSLRLALPKADLDRLLRRLAEHLQPAHAA
jgi:hypothetical protein